MLMGAVYALPLTTPFLLIESLSDDAGSGLYLVGLFGIPLGGLVIQIREARAVPLADRLGRRVLRAALPFFGGALLVVFIAFVPVARLVGTFDVVDRTSIFGELLFGLFALTFGIAMLISAALVVGIASISRRLSRAQSPID